MAKLFVATVLACSALIVVPGEAQTIHKCKDAAGRITYSQTGCTAKQASVGTRAYKPEANAPHDYGQYRTYQPVRAQQGYAPRATNGTPGLIGGSYYDADNARRASERERQLIELEIARQKSERIRSRNDGQSRIGDWESVNDVRTGRRIEGVRTAPNQILDPKTGRYIQVID